MQGVEVTLKTTFADGKAVNALTEGTNSTEKIDAVSADPVVLPNVFFGSYAALAARLAGAAVGAELKAYIAPQAEIAVVVTEVTSESIETPKRTFAAKRYTLAMKNPGGDVSMVLWADDAGGLVRLSVPAQSLEIAREDVASAASRMTAFTIDGDESVRIAANGFNLAGTVTKPVSRHAAMPAVVLIGGSGPADRDGMVAGIPVMGHVAKALVEAGFLVVRYDKRGIGQSGGRPETATLADYADDARAVVNYLRKDRKDVDDDRIAVVGHSEGAWVALQLGALTRDVEGARARGRRLGHWRSARARAAAAPARPAQGARRPRRSRRPSCRPASTPRRPARGPGTACRPSSASRPTRRGSPATWPSIRRGRSRTRASRSSSCRASSTPRCRRITPTSWRRWRRPASARWPWT